MLVIRAALVLAFVLPAVPKSQCQTVQGVGSASDPNAHLGGATAVSGDYCVVGSSDSDAYAVDAGAATVYRRTGDTWVTHQTLGNLVTLHAGDHFGNAVAIDGGMIAVGAYATDGQFTDEGVVHIFKQDASGVFGFQKMIFPSPPMSPSPNQMFGNAVALTDGVLAVGSYLWDGSGTDSGCVYFYTQGGTFFDLKTNGSGSAGDHFGCRVAGNDGVFVVGAELDDVGPADAGSARVFQLDEQGELFGNNGIKLTASSIQAGATFGAAVAVGDGVCAVGAPFDDSAGPDAGAVHIYRFHGGGWYLEQKVFASTPQASGQFGSALSMDGSTLVVGNPRHDLPVTDCGSVEVFRRAGHTWLNTAHLSNATSGQGDAFGTAVAVDGSTISVGAPLDDNGTALDTGSVTAFSFTACPGLFAWRTTTTNALPDPIQFSLNAGSAYASRQYVMLGSVSGTSPGFPLKGATVPLNPDVYLNLTLGGFGVPSFSGFWGVLNAQGRGSATLLLPPFVPPAVLGLTFQHAFVAKGSGSSDWFASNAEPLGLIEEWDPPYAEAGPDLFVDEESFNGGATVHLDGDDSSSLNGWIVNWIWTFGDGTSKSGDPTVDHKYLTGGTYTAKLVVFDEVGAAQQDICIVHINKMPLGLFSILTASPKVNQLVEFDGSASFDPDGTIDIYRWTFDFAVKETLTPTTTHVFATPGPHHITMTPIDDDGLAGSNIAEADISVAP